MTWYPNSSIMAEETGIGNTQETPSGNTSQGNIDRNF